MRLEEKRKEKKRRDGETSRHRMTRRDEKKREGKEKMD